MMKSTSTVLKLGVASAALVLLAGCASQGSVDALQAELDEVRATALQEAGTALTAAEAAAVAASAAQATADDNAEKIDRMFERSMYK